MVFDYTLVCTTYNDSDSIIPFLKNIEKQTRLPSEVVIADGGSKDDTVKIIQDYSDKSKLKIKLVYGKRLNIAQGYNEAIKNTEAEVIAVAGVGNFYSTDFFEKLYSTMSETGAEIVYSPISGQENTAFQTAYNSIFLGGKNGLTFSCPSNHGSLVKKSVFEKMGLFYENFWYAGEDSEFYQRCQKAGIKIALNNEARVFWDTPHTWKEFLRQREVYTVGGMQRLGYTLLRQSLTSFMKVFAVFFIILLALFKLWILFGISAVLYAAYLIRSACTSTALSFLIKITTPFLSVYYILKNFRFMKTKYRVDLEKYPVK